MTAAQFRRTLERLAAAWAEKRYEDAAVVFAADVLYLDPLRYTNRGRGELLAFFRQDEGLPQTTLWRHVFFDEAAQVGAAEYSFRGTHLYHGVVLVKVQGDLITHWREFQHVTDLDWEFFFKGAAF